MGTYQHGITGEQKVIPDAEAPGPPWYQIADSQPAEKKTPTKKKD